MKEFYSINEVAQMTGLTTKTLRNYIADGFLVGEKSNGKWLFSMDAVQAMITAPFVDASIKIKSSSVVKDFLDNDKKKEDGMCLILDKKVGEEQAIALGEFLCQQVNRADNQVVMKYSQKAGNARIILSGLPNQVMPILMAYNEKF